VETPPNPEIGSTEQGSAATQEAGATSTRAERWAVTQAARGEPGLAAGMIVGEYRLEERLGEGGFGSVYRCTHTVIGKIAAVKILHLAFSSDPQVVSRFLAEARAVNQIRHKHIVDIFAFGRLDDGRHFYVMELLEGESLSALLERKGRLTIAEAVTLLRPIARALDAAHAAGIAHRDLKPENILLARDIEGGMLPKLLDFGIAKLLDGEATHTTRPGATIGTPQYMSPEQCAGRAVDHQTDVYSFGVLLHEVLTGKRPFEGSSPLRVMALHLEREPPRASHDCSDLPEAVDAPILSMLAKGPAQRPASVSAGLEALASAARAAGVVLDGASEYPRSDRSVGEAAASEPVLVPRASVSSRGGRASPTYENAPTIQAETIVAGDSAERIHEPGHEQPSKRRRWVLPAIALGVGALLASGVWLNGRARPAPATPPLAATTPVAVATAASTGMSAAPSNAGAGSGPTVSVEDSAAMRSGSAGVSTAVTSNDPATRRSLPLRSNTARPTGSQLHSGYGDDPYAQ